MAASRPPRSRRFALPEHADERVGQSIEAFLTGPQRRRGRPADAARSTAHVGDPLGALDNRLAWNEALRRETARARRYERPAAVVVVISAPMSGDPGVLDRWQPKLAGAIAHVIRRGSRETDLVTRAAEARCQILLPETTELEAAHFAERVAADCEGLAARARRAHGGPRQRRGRHAAGQPRGGPRPRRRRARVGVRGLRLLRASLPPAPAQRRRAMPG